MGGFAREPRLEYFKGSLYSKFGSKIKIFDVSKILILRPFKIWIARQKLNLAVISANRISAVLLFFFHRPWATLYLRYFLHHFQLRRNTEMNRGWPRLIPRLFFILGNSSRRTISRPTQRPLVLRCQRLVQIGSTRFSHFSGAVFVEFPHGSHHVNYCACRTRNNTCMSAFRKTFI